MLGLLIVGRAGAAEVAKVDFARDVQPILSDNCYRCHGPDGAARKGDLRLDVREEKLGPLVPRDGYRIVAPGDLDESVLIERITSDDPEVHMPPPESNRRLSEKQIDVLRRWVQQGAEWGKHWSFLKPVRATPPQVKENRWVRNPIDQFVLAQMENQGVKPSAEAPRHTLLRRAALDLVGLPPTLAELDAFSADTSADAYQKQVDRLLASPHFGERQARHWLDQARYADSNGYSHDLPRSVWPYRDWVINALNRDMPFDQFTIEQLAGDLLPKATLEQKIATGFHRNTQINTEGGIDHEQFRVEAVVDRVATTATVFLGLTVACAQCHDHKFDPISQKEYYELFAFFNNCDEPSLKVGGVTDPDQIEALKRRIEQLEGAVKEKIAAWEADLTADESKTLKPEAQDALEIPAAQRNEKENAAVQAALRTADNDFGAMADDLAAVKKQLSEGVTTLVMRQRKDEPRKTHLLIKGDFTRPADEVTPGVPVSLHRLKVAKPTTAPTRLDLARWITDPQNPLTARVIVNRIWQQYFGRGLVETENDFGSQGIAPTHPELLDWLATELVANQWSLKHIHRLIATSATYRQSSNIRPDLENVDPYNKLLARQSRIRLDAEVVRDVALASSGLLTPRIGGPSVFPPIPQGVMGLGQIKQDWRTSQGPDRYRRGMYTFTFRNSLHPSLSSFDAPDAISACTRRIRSNTPLQALNLLNDSAWMEFSRALAARSLKEAPSNDSNRIAHLFRLAASRTPDADEQLVLARLLDKKRSELAEKRQEADLIVANVTPLAMTKPDFAAWTLVARAILNLDETISRE
jgi:hypothetical protein